MRSGPLPRDAALRKTGDVVHSRWLTTGSTFLYFLTRKHWLEWALYTRLETIVTYLVSLYFHLFSLIKVKHS